MRKPPIHKSFGNAFRGILGLLKTERNFQIHFAALVINIFLIILLKVEKYDVVLIILVSAFVLVTEILNTAIEKICDFIQLDYDKRIGFIKDISAGAVLLTAIAALIVGVVVYWKYISQYI